MSSRNEDSLTSALPERVVARMDGAPLVSEELAKAVLDGIRERDRRAPSSICRDPSPRVGMMLPN
jgi:hypothetical protein